MEKITGTEAFNKAIEKGNVIMEFSAPWCGYCRRLHPMVERIEGEIDFPIYEINCDDDEEIVKKYEVETIPNLIFFKDGKPVDSIIGYGNVGYPELKAFVEKNK